jgi:type III pantothenate kinase
MLLVDAGNTRIKWGLRAEGMWLARGVRPLAEALELPHDWSSHVFQRALLCWVADAYFRDRIAASLDQRGIQARWLTARREAHGLRSEYDPPESLGADRYAALVAAQRRSLGPVLVVSAGTALTADALLADGHFLGGIILPGADLMRDALLRGTAGVRDVPAVVSERQDDFPGSTGAAVATGIALAQAGAVERLRARLAARVGGQVPVLLGGGARAGIASLLAAPVIEADDLVLEGLAAIAGEESWDDC